MKDMLFQLELFFKYLMVTKTVSPFVKFLKQLDNSQLHANGNLVLSPFNLFIIQG